MSEIPDDVMTASVGVKTLLRFTPETEWGSIIARAILAERQRCADVVEDYCSDMPDLAGHGHSIGLKDAILAGDAP